MTRVAWSKVGVLVVCLLMVAVVPASAQLADPLSLAASGVVLPFFSDSAAGFVSVLEIVSPVVPADFTNPLHMVFFRETCVRDTSIGDLHTAKQAKTYISTASPLTLTFNGLAAIASTLQGNDLIPLNFPLHTRTHWIDVKTGRLREVEPIILDTFVSLNAAFVPLVLNAGAGASIGLCNNVTNTYVAGFRAGATAFANTGASGIGNNGYCWSPLRSAGTFVTPQETALLKASVILICPTADIQQGSSGAATAAGVSLVGPPAQVFHSGGVFNPATPPAGGGFPRIVNRDGSSGFPFRNVTNGLSPMGLRGRIYNDDESGPKNFVTPCSCVTITPVLSIDSLYSLAPTNLGAFTVPVWYTELETQTVSSNANTGEDAFSSQFSWTGYWNLDITGREGTLFHRMSTASLDNLSFGTNNPFANR